MSNTLEFITGRFYSPDEDQVIKAVKAVINDEPVVIFTDKVRQIEGVIIWVELTESDIMDNYDKGYYKDATTAEAALVV